MYASSFLVVLCCTMIATCIAYPAGIEDIFAGFVKNTNLNSPDKNGEIVKRRIYEENPDAGLKQISLQSLIGDLEHTLYQSAASVSHVAHNKDIKPDVPAVPADHPIEKRHTEDESASKQQQQQQLQQPTQPDGKSVVLETTEKIPEKEGIPAHILIDRISVQPHFGGLPLIPAFQVQHTKLLSATIKDQGPTSTKISITKTDIKASGSEVATASESQKNENPESTTSTILTTASTTTTTSAGPTPTSAQTTSTKKPTVDLKEAEEELKEKVAEIEAEPVILSARV